MSFEYSFSREEYLKANAKYMRKQTALQLFLGIACVCLLVIMFIVTAIKNYVLNDPLDYTKSTAFVYILTFFCILFFTLVLLLRYSYKKAHENFFNDYNEDGLLRYRVELTETEVVVSYKQNVAHLSLKGITRTVEISGYLFALSNINSILIVKITDETQPLVDKLKSCVPVKKKKKA